MNFTSWLNESEELRRLNEAFDEKDHKRIEDIVKKAGGDRDKEISLATTMAKVITDKNKAERRAEAAEEQGLDHLRKIFQNRANEIAGKAPEEDVEDAEETTKSAKKPREKKKKPAPPAKIKVGDYLKVSGNMILEGKVAAAATGGWRYITATNKGDRIITHTSPGRSSRYGRYSSASTRIDKDYVTSLGDQGVFYIKVKKAGQMWLEGEACFFNGLTNDSLKVRIEKKNVIPAGPELEIFLKPENLELLSTMKRMRKFVIGDENFLMKKDGSADNDVTPGLYALLELDYKLTVDTGEPVVYCIPDENMHQDDKLVSKGVFFAPLSKMKDLQGEITKEQMQVIADFLSKEIGATIDIYAGQKFDIPWFKIEGSKAEGYLSNFYERPFFSKAQAEARIEELKELSKKEKLPYSTENLSVNKCSSYDNFRVTLGQLLDYSKLVGIEVKMRKFLEDKRGSIKGKEFGF